MHRRKNIASAQDEPSQACPLCEALTSEPFHRDRRRSYVRCPVCFLIWVPRQYLPTPQDEKAEYELHQNHPGDLGYRRFLGRLFDPLMDRLAPGSSGLDVGSGPGPTLSVMFEEAGHSMAIYDPFYAPNREALEATYDFVTATEVVEHLHRPKQDLLRWWALLRPGGWLGLMTKLALGAEEFAHWHYKNDITHVSFFSRTTFDWLGARWTSPPIFIGRDVILFQKISASGHSNS